jgi:hypothetical protein
MVPELQHFKGWFDAREYGELSRAAPLQCAAARAAWDPAAAALAEEQLDSLFESSGPIPGLSLSVGNASRAMPGDSPTEAGAEAAADLIADSFFAMLPRSPRASALGELDMAASSSNRGMLETLAEFECMSGGDAMPQPPVLAEGNKRARTMTAPAPTANIVASPGVAVAAPAPAPVPMGAGAACMTEHDNLRSRFKSARQRHIEEVSYRLPRPAALAASRRRVLFICRANLLRLLVCRFSRAGWGVGTISKEAKLAKL